MAKVIKSFDGNNFGTDYVAVILDGEGISLPGVTAQMARRVGAWPLVAGIDRPGVTFPLGIAIEGTDEDALRLQLLQWFDPEDEAPKELVATDADGASNERFVECVCEALNPVRGRGGIVSRLYVASLRLHDDVRWRAASVTTESAWNITASGQTVVVNNQGEDLAFPVLTVEPTSAKATGFQYKRWCPVIWNATTGGSQYPVMLGPFNFTGDAQADGDDVRVYVNGVERDRWLSGTLVSAVEAWVNLDFEVRIVAEVGTAIAATGAVDEIVSSLSIVDFPSSGILLIEDEAFVYTGKSDYDQTFTGVSRAAKGTSMAAHIVGTGIDWIQHDIEVYYGDSSLSAPVVDDDYKPAFDLELSSNSTWEYVNFGDNGGKRGYAWLWEQLEKSSGATTANYTATHGGSASPWSVLGIQTFAPHGAGWKYGSRRRYIYVPCGITGADFEDGEYKFSSTVGSPTGDIRLDTSSDGSSWVDQETYLTAELTDDGSWYDWPDKGDGAGRRTLSFSSQKYVGMKVEAVSFTDWNTELYSETGNVTLTLDATGIPDTNSTIMANAINVYQLDATITNETTGDAITLSFGMEVNEELEVDSVNKTVTYLEDGSGQRQALGTGGVRKHWLALAVGNNTLRYDETGLVGVTVTVEYRKRYYS